MSNGIRVLSLPMSASTSSAPRRGTTLSSSQMTHVSLWNDEKCLSKSAAYSYACRNLSRAFFSLSASTGKHDGRQSYSDRNP